RRPRSGWETAPTCHTGSDRAGAGFRREPRPADSKLVAEPQLSGLDDRLQLRMDGQLAPQGADVRAHRCIADAELGRDGAAPGALRPPRPGVLRPRQLA